MFNLGNECDPSPSVSIRGSSSPQPEPSPITDHSAPRTDTEGVSILIDTETLGLTPGSVITSIAVIAFTRRDLTVIDHLEIVPDFFEQLSIGRTFDPETLAFHRRNKTLPRTDAGEETPCIEAVVNLAAFIRHHQPHRVWIQGPDFDRPLIEDLCKSFKQPLPWHFSKSRDARTAYDIAFPGKKHPPRPHKALQDCQETLIDLAEALSKLNARASI
jgi:hypothetical protein